MNRRHVRDPVVQALFAFQDKIKEKLRQYDRRHSGRRRGFYAWYLSGGWIPKSVRGNVRDYRAADSAVSAIHRRRMTEHEYLNWAKKLGVKLKES